MMYPLWMWAVFAVSVMALLAFDLGVLHKKSREIGVREALYLSLFYFALSMIFNLWLYFAAGPKAASEFFVGYLIEKSLSMDNIFVFVLIFTHFSIPRKAQHRVIFWGIMGAIFLRGTVIMLGAGLIHRFSDILYVFGAILIVSGIKMLKSVDAEPDLENNRILNFMRRNFRVSPPRDDERFFVRENGLRMMTPLFMVLVLVQVTDLIFAVDSIPAIFAITTDSFIVLTSNVFAILGLRALFFALAAILHRFHYLKYGLSLILVFIGGKMIVNHYMGTAFIPTTVSLGVTVALLVLSVIFSLIKTKNQPPHTEGWVPGSDNKPE